MYFLYCADDNPLHLKKARESIDLAIQARNIGYEHEVIECGNGKELLDSIATRKPRFITLDINMPVMDGLTTLVKVRAQGHLCPIVMVSSENEDLVSRLGTNIRKTDDEAKKEEMLGRVIDRVKANAEEPGKINSVLEACANLGMDPVKIAKRCGATAFIHKPYQPPAASEVMAPYL